MSGVEVAGLAIGLLPIIFSAINNYQSLVSRPFSRYSSFSKDVDRYLTRLDNQRVIFRKDCFLLLSDLVNSDDADLMLANPEEYHQYWSDEGLDYQLADILGESRQQCMRTLEQIDSILADIEQERVKLTKALENETEGDRENKILAKTWRRHVRAKLKFSFSETRLSQNLSAMTDFIHDFKNLRSSLDKPCRSMKLNDVSSQGSKSRELQMHQTIGEASQGVYEALQSACNKHIEHCAHLCVEVEQVSGRSVSSPQFKFSLSYTSVAAQTEPLWFAIETVMNEIVLGARQTNVSCDSHEVRSLKRSREPGPEPPSKEKKGKCLRFTIPPTIDMRLPQATPVDQNLATQDRINGDFCDFLRRHCRCSGKQSTKVGILGNKARWKSLVYPMEPKAKTQHLQSMSLRNIISLISRDNLRRFSIYERLHLAKTISVAFLRHHTTEWGRACWESENICFFDINQDGTDKPIRLTSPHLNARICGPNGTPPASQRTNASGSRNTLLFNLGVLFLEIAHSADWETLKRRHFSHVEDQGTYADFLHARKLAKMRSSGIPGKYHDVIERLIECDFAQGDDLSKPGLQAAFHRDVIGPLEDVETRLKELNLDE
ncbi:uncharacterized protein KY384_004603 [Bacidia gigantensis]|uniref:uncharacterized protein n=1 Tax=Bacidia gigantensis TaxID=2732470 RepID=UPI001D037B74|nr:uncharacterized protein KY384_004603 [Bacidia gigantensis]KAG8531245.1 hypothetical protein KY384_004603 [Bacidia gigantensis]